MFLKTFTKHYDLHLLPAAHSRILLGNLIWKPFWGKPTLSHPGLPNHISNALYDIGLVDKTKWQNLLNQLDMPICQNAHLAKINIENAGKVAGSLLDGLGLGFEHGYMLQAEISAVCTKVMSNELRTQLDSYLEQIQPKLMRTLFRNPRKAYLITELYYGSVKIKVEKQHEIAFENRIAATKWPIQTDHTTDKSTDYVFAHNEVPFAYKMERIHRFNG